MNHNKYTPEQEAWLTALESGEYKQVKQNLCVDGAYCCLGVATLTIDPDHEALAENGWDTAGWAAREVALEDPRWFYSLEEGPLAPPDVVATLRLSGSDGKFRFGHIAGDASSLANLNDDLGMTFPEIAAFIRAKPWWVFTNFDAPKPEATA